MSEIPVSSLPNNKVNSHPADEYCVIVYQPANIFQKTIVGLLKSLPANASAVNLVITDSS